MTDFMSSVGVGLVRGLKRVGDEACGGFRSVVGARHGGRSTNTPVVGVALVGASRAVAGMSALAVAFVAVSFGQSNANAALISAWNMNALGEGKPPVLAATTGFGTLDCTGLGGGYNFMQGTTLGAQPGETAGNALAVVGSAFNQSAIYVDLAIGDVEDVALNFAVRRSSTGFASNRIDYWTGFTWIAFANFGASTTAWELQSHRLGGGMYLPAGTLSLRIVVDGATGSTGSIRFDNMSVSGTPVPAPGGALALLGLAGCVARRRR
jgi:MYXO-CTERM domain-containing protein